MLQNHIPVVFDTYSITGGSGAKADIGMALPKIHNTRGVNVFDLCAISLPMNLIKRKWLSVSIIAKKNNEGKLLAVAEKIESILL